MAIIDEINAVIPAGKHFEIQPDRSLAIQKAIAIATDDDIVLIAGKGHEDYQEFNGRTEHFDDREEVQKAIS